MIDFLNRNTSALAKNPEFIEELQNIVTLKNFNKNDLLHRSGEICKEFYLIISGLARVFYFKDGKDITVHFAAEQESFTAIDSLIQRKKSKYSIEALEDLQVYVVNFNDLEVLFEKKPEYEHFGRLFLQEIYVNLVERIDDLQLHNSKEKYTKLLAKKPHLFKRVASKHIASFLGMSAETLSRIRGNY